MEHVLEHAIGGASEEKTSGAGGWRGRDWRERGGRRACETFFTAPLPPIFVTYFGNWISAAEMLICQFTEIVRGFLAQVDRANPVREQVTIV